MPRAPVLPSLVEAANASGKPTYAGPRTLEADGYAERLVKYIPGEAIAFFLPFASLSAITDGQLIGVLIVAEVVTLLWSINRNSKLKDLRRPTILVTLWSLLAFPAWALGTSAATQHLLEWPALTCTLILAATAVLIPALDELIVRSLIKRGNDED